MRTRSRPGPALLLLGALAIALGAARAQPLAKGAGAGAETGGRGLHLMVAVQGKVSVKRKGWRVYAPAGFGTVLRLGDLLSLEGASRATVACADLTVHEMPAGLSGVPCPATRPALLVYEGSLLNPTRADVPDEIPVVVSPRRTKLLARRPRLRWEPMVGVAEFEVSVRGPGVDWSAVVRSATEVAYPENAPALQPGAVYKVSVVAGGRSSDEASAPGLGFTLLSPEEARAVSAERERIQQLRLASAATKLLTAHLYASRGLKAEAIEQLEDLTKDVKAPAVLQALGAFDQEAGLYRLAEKRYLDASRRSQDAGEIEGQALAQQALGSLYHDAFGDESAAARSLHEALALFQRLGDADAIHHIEELLRHGTGHD